MVMVIRVAGDKEGEGNEEGDGVGGKTKKAIASAARVMAIRVATII